VSEWTVHTGDCLEVMAGMEANTFDAIVTDPPYGLAFMGKAWDHAVPGPEFFAAMLRVAKPGAHIVAFGGTRLYHRMTCAMEDAGWEIRDCLMWLYGSGFPKSRMSQGDRQGRGHPKREAIPTASRYQNGTTTHLHSNPVDDYEAAPDRRCQTLARLGHRPETRVGADRAGPQAAGRDGGAEPPAAWVRGGECGWVSGGDGCSRDQCTQRMAGIWQHGTNGGYGDAKP
jgi:hypothetical protein